MIPQIQKGIIANLPVAASVGAYGSILGVLAAQKNVSWLELLLMNLTIFAGSAQFVMVDMWGTHIPVLEMILAVTVINLRYLLIGASLNQVFQGSSMTRKAVIMHFVADENWAVTMAEQRKGTATIWFLLGGGLCIFSVWCFGTLFGHQLGAFVRHPELWAFDFAFTAVFTAFAVNLCRGKTDILPWLVAAVLAVVSEIYLPGKWYIVIGGIGGALLQFTTSEEKKR